MDQTTLGAALSLAAAVAAGALVIVASARAPRAPAARLGVACVAVSTVVQAVALLGDRSFGGGWDAGLYTVGLALVCVTYPDGRVPDRWLHLPLAGAGALAVVAVATGGDVVAQAWWTLAQLAMLALVGVVVHRYRRRLDTAEREQVRWAVLGIVLVLGTMLPLVGYAALRGDGTLYSVPGATLAGGAVIGAFPLCLAVGLAAPRVLPVDEVLRAALTAWAVVVPLVATYLAVSMAWGPASGAVVVTVLSPPLVAGSWIGAGRVVYGRRLSPPRAAWVLSLALRRNPDPAAAPQVVADVVARAVGAAGVQVGGPAIRTGRCGEAPGTETFPVDYAGETLGRIAVAPRPAETALTWRDRATVARLAADAGPALHGARLVHELDDERARLARVRDQERRRLRRDLHDDLAPALMGLALAAEGIARTVQARDPGLAGTAAELAAGVQAAIRRTRELAHDLRPADLGAGGLAAAVRERVAALGDDDLQVRVAAPDDLSASWPVELAALRITQEAVANVRTHARATRCEVTLSRDGTGLRLRIDDDGTGMALGEVDGFGLRSIRARAAELGGRMALSRSPSGGVRVEALLPEPS